MIQSNQSNQSNLDVNQLAQGQAMGEFAQGGGEPIVAQPGQHSIPEPPQLHQVHAGDLITAQYFNDLVLAIENLQARIEVLESYWSDSFRAEAAS